MNNSSSITASEIADYIYCKRGWWLKTQGLLQANQAMLSGTDKHNRLAQLLFTHKWKVLVSLVIIGLGLLGIVLTIVYNMFFG